MKKATEIDLADTADALESLQERIPKMTITEKVDVAARLRAVHKLTEAMDEVLKADIKKHLKGKDGTVKGEIFKAVVATGPVTRLDQKALKEQKPEIHAQFSELKPQTVVKFEPR